MAVKSRKHSVVRRLCLRTKRASLPWNAVKVALYLVEKLTDPEIGTSSVK